MLEIIPYKRGLFPSLLALIEETGIGRPKQRRHDFIYVESIDIAYNLNWGPKKLRENESVLLKTLEDDLSRYEGAYKGERIWFSAEIETGIAKQVGESRDIKTLPTHTWGDAEGVIWGQEGDKHKSLNDLIEEIKDWYKRYRLPKGYKNLYIVKKVVVSIRCKM